MTDVTIEAGTVTLSREDRTVTGMLLPYGEVGRTTLGKFSVPRGTVSVPEDPAVVTLNVEHAREEPVGRATSLIDSAAGVLATFAIAKTPEGDAYLADLEAGRRNALSAEVKKLVIRSGKAVSGRLFGAAGTVAGAFPSATLLAADAGPDDEIVLDGVRYARVPDPETTDSTVLPDQAAAAAESEAPVAETETAPEATAEEEQTLHASLPHSLRKTAGQSTKGEGATLFASLAGKTLSEAATLLAALDNAIAADVVDTQQKQWLGEIYASRTYQRRFAPLVQQGTLNALKAVGWRFTTGKTPTVAPYAGFPNQPNSTEVKTEAVTLDAVRLAGAGAVDRAFIDFPTPEFWAGYFREFTNDYERKLDAIARDFYVASSTAVVAGAVPGGVATAAAYIVDGAISVLNAERDLPSFAIVGSDLYRGLLLTRADDVIAFLNAALGLEDGTLANFKIVPSAAATLTGKVLVGTKTSATVFELPGSPVRVDTLSIATGGVERGVFGYHAELANDTTGLALVAPAG